VEAGGHLGENNSRSCEAARISNSVGKSEGARRQEQKLGISGGVQDANTDEELTTGVDTT